MNIFLRILLSVFCFFVASSVNAQAFIDGNPAGLANSNVALYSDTNALEYSKTWTATTGGTLITSVPQELAVYSDGGDEIGIWEHTITGDTERMASSAGSSIATGLVTWDGNRKIVYEFGAKLIDTYITSGCDSTSGLINRMSANYIGASFRFETTTSTTMMFAETFDGATRTNTLIASISPFAWHRFRIELSKTPRTANFYIDGTLVATHTTNLPPTTTPISPAVRTARYSATNTYKARYGYQRLEVTQ